MKRFGQPQIGLAALGIAAGFFAGLTTCPAWGIETNLLIGEDSAGRQPHVFEVHGFAGKMVLSQFELHPWNRNFQAVAMSGDRIYSLTSTNNLYRFEWNRYSLSYGQDNVLHLPEAADDVAYTAGRVFYVASQGDRLKVSWLPTDLVSGNSTLLTNTSVSVPASGKWKLVGAANANVLLAYRADAPGVNSGTARPAFLLNPTTGQVISQMSIPPAGGAVTDVTLNRNGTELTLITAGNGMQTRVSVSTGQVLGMVPGGATQGVGGSLLASEIFGPRELLAASNSVDFPFLSANDRPHVVLDMQGTLPGATGSKSMLYRRPRVVTTDLEVNLVNGVLPDDMSSFQVSLPLLATQTFGPSPIQFSHHPSSLTSFTARSLGTVTATIDLAQAQPGFYRIEGAVPAGTNVFEYFGDRRDFAYDPVSANIVGDGTFKYNGLGWDFSGYAGPAISRALTPAYADVPAGFWQDMELPTAQTAMELKFDYELRSLSGTALLTVMLEDVVIGTISLNQLTPKTPVTFSVTDPSLMGVEGARLSFMTTTNGMAELYVGNISLMAVPEPASGLVMVGLTLLGLARRR